MGNIYVQFNGMVYNQIVGIPMDTNYAPLIADLFLYCYERIFMSNLQKYKPYDLIDKFNNTARYLDDIFAIEVCAEVSRDNSLNETYDDQGFGD